VPRLLTAAPEQKRRGHHPCRLSHHQLLLSFLLSHTTHTFVLSLLSPAEQHQCSTQCPNDCAGADGKVCGKCDGAKCICNAGWTGLDCGSACPEVCLAEQAGHHAAAAVGASGVHDGNMMAASLNNSSTFESSATIFICAWGRYECALVGSTRLMLAALPLLADTSISAPARRLTFTIRFSLLQYFLVFLVARSTAQAAHVVLRMVPYVAAASCSGSGRTPREVAWGLALAAGSRLIDAKVGNFWKKPTGGTPPADNCYGATPCTGYGVSCTDACATPATGGCDESGLSEADSEASFKLAKPDAMTCNAYFFNAYPIRTSNGRCYFGGTSGTCDAKMGHGVRLCACKCGAGSFQPQSAIARSCQT